MAKKTAPTALELAEKLLRVRTEKNELAAVEKALVAALLPLVKRGDPQDIFKIVPTQTLKVTDPQKALEWARVNAPQTISVDVTKAKRILQVLFSGIPDGFELKTTEQLRVAKDESDAPGVAIEI